jgi:hypothetical protein
MQSRMKIGVLMAGAECLLDPPHGSIIRTIDSFITVRAHTPISWGATTVSAHTAFPRENASQDTTPSPLVT